MTAPAVGRRMRCTTAKDSRRGVSMMIVIGAVFGFIAWFLVRYLLAGLYTVNQNERAVKTSFGRAQRVAAGATTLSDKISEGLDADERTRYAWPQLRVIMPGGP